MMRPGRRETATTGPRGRAVLPALASLLLAGLLLGAGPSAAQETGLLNPETTTPVVLYMHLDGIQDFPINTQPPNPAFADTVETGVQGHTTSCVPETPLPLPIARAEKHTFYGYSSPGYVEYDFLEDGKPRYHPERGLSYEVKLDPTAPFVVHWYLETHTGAPESEAAEPDQVPVPLPNVIVRATMRTGDAVGVGDESYNTGPLIAFGETVATLAGPATSGAEHSVNGTRNIYHFAVPMKAGDIATIPRETGYNLRIDVLVDDNGLCPEGMVMPDFVGIHTSDGHRPRIELSILNPIRIEYMHPQFIGQDLYIHASLNSPWGNYDVDEGEGGLALTVEGPSTPASLERAAFTQRFHEHNHHQEAVDISYLWHYVSDDAEVGDYTLRLDAWNDQRTGKASAVAAIHIDADAARNQATGCGDLVDGSSGCTTSTGTEGHDGKDSPAGVWLAVAAVALAGLLTGRRR